MMAKALDARIGSMYVILTMRLPLINTAVWLQVTVADRQKPQTQIKAIKTCHQHALAAVMYVRSTNLSATTTGLLLL